MARRYSEEQIEQGLLILARHGGRALPASEQLLDDFGWQDADDESRDTALNRVNCLLRGWRDRNHSERYTQLHEQEAERLRKVVTAGAEEIVLDAQDLERELLDDLRAKKDELPAKELAGAARNVATVKALSADKILYRDRPEITVQHNIGLDENLRELVAMGIKVLQGPTEAEQIQEAELVELTGP